MRSPIVLPKRFIARFPSSALMRSLSLQCFVASLAVALFASCALPKVKPLKQREAQVGRDIPGDREEFNRLQTQLNSGDKPGAIQGFKDFVQRFPDSRLTDDALLQLGNLYREDEQYREAAGSYQKIIELFPTSDTIYSAQYYYGVSKFRLGEIADAMPLLESVETKSFPDEFRLSFLEILREGYRQQENDSRLFETDLAILELKRGDPDVRDEIIELIQDKLAVDDLEEIKDRNKGEFPSGYVAMRLAKYYFSEGDFGKSKSRLKNFLTKFRDSGIPHEYTSEASNMLQRLESLDKEMPGRVGVLLPLSGPYQQVGRRILNGILLASELLSDQDQVVSPDQPKLELIVKDSAGDELQAEKAVEELVLDHQVVTILGPMLKRTTRTAAKLGYKFRVPAINMSQDEEIAASSDYIFQNCLRKSDQARALVRYATQELGISRFAMMYPQHSYGRDMFWYIWDELKQTEGVSITGVEAYQRDQADFGPQIRRLTGLFYLKARPEKICARNKKQPGCFVRDELPPIVDFEALIVPDSAEKVRQIAPTLSYYGVRGVQLLGGNLWNNEELLQKDTPAYVQGATFVDGFFAGSKDPIVRDFVTKYRETFGEDPDILSAQAFDSMSMLMQAYEQGKLEKRDTLRRYLASLQDFRGAVGQTTFASDGTPERQIFFFMIDGKKIRPLYDEDGQFPKAR